MVVYVEAVFINNFVIDAAVLSVGRKTLRAQRNTKRLLLGALVGATFACVSPFLPFGGMKLFLLKTGVGALISKCGIDVKGGRRFLLSYALFFGYTFLLGGAVTGLSNLLPLPSGSIGTGVTVGLGYALFRLCAHSFAIGKKINSTPAFYYQVTLYSLAGESVTAAAFLDTGNRLTKGGAPVFAVNQRVFSALYEVGCGVERYALSTVAGESEGLLYPIARAVCKGKNGEITVPSPYLLLTKTPLPISGCEVLLGPAALTEGENVSSINLAV